MRIQPPQQISSVPEIDNGAMGWSRLLVDGLAKIRISELSHGDAVATWPGGQTFSTAQQVTHGLSRQAGSLGGGGVFTQALGVVAGSNGPPLSSVVAGATAQQFQIQFFTIDGVAPIAGSTINFFWVAMI